MAFPVRTEESFRGEVTFEFEERIRLGIAGPGSAFENGGAYAVTGAQDGLVGDAVEGDGVAGIHANDRDAAGDFRGWRSAFEDAEHGQRLLRGGGESFPHGSRFGKPGEEDGETSALFSFVAKRSFGGGAEVRGGTGYR